MTQTSTKLHQDSLFGIT